MYAQTKRLVILGVVIVVGALAWFFGRPALRDWRATNFLEESEEFAAAGNWPEAKRTAMTSLQMKPSLDASRILFRAMRAEGNSRTLLTGVGIFRHPQATKADRLEIIDLALQQKDYLMVTGLLRELPKGSLDDPEFALRQARFYLQTERPREAVAVADAQQKGPLAADFEFLILQSLFRSGSEESRAQALQLAAKLLGDKDAGAASKTVRQLSLLPAAWVTDELRAKALARLSGDQSLPVEDRLALATLKLSSQGADRDEIVNSVVAQMKDANRPALVAWLARAGEWEQIVDLTESRDIDLPSFNHRTTALSKLQRWDQLKAELDSPPVAIPKPHLHAAQAVLALQRGEPSEAAALWHRAFSGAESDRSRNHFYVIASIASQAGESERRMEALARAIEHPLGIPPPSQTLDSLFAWLIEKGESKRLRNISFHLLRREPGNPTLINNFHYLQALYDELSDNSVAILRDLVKTYPDRHDYRSSLSLALVRAGEAEEALRVLDSIDGAPSSLATSEKAVYAATLAALERFREAFDIRDQINWKELSPDETRILRALASGEEAR